VDTRLSALNSVTNEFGFVNSTDKVNGQIISQGEKLVVSNEFLVDMTKRVRCTLFTTIFAETRCKGMDANIWLGGTTVNRVP
jgi:hypothetical protein